MSSHRLSHGRPVLRPLHRSLLAAGALALVAAAPGCGSGAASPSAEPDGPVASASQRLGNGFLFDAKTNGLQFYNTFLDDVNVPAPVVGIGLPFDITVRTGGLCGGMAYTAFDYYYANMNAPKQNYRPADGTVLKNYIYGRQVDSLMSNLDKWAEIGFNPGGVRNSEFFQWGLQDYNGGRIEELRLYLDVGIPVPIGLQGANGSGNHQMLAIGYDMGRYKGDLGAYEGDFKIFVYDPNHPGQTVTLVPNLASQVYTIQEYPNKDQWQTYFVDRNYSPKTPPTVADPVYPDDGLVHELFVYARTGGDDLRGGGDNIDLWLSLADGSNVSVPNINGGQRWINDYFQTVRLALPRAVDPQTITGVHLRDTFGGGISGDNWNMEALRVQAVGHKTWVLARSGSKRFTGDDKQLDLAPLQLPPLVTSIAPASGLAGSTITITGTHFDPNGNTHVLFGSTPSSSVACSTTQCTAVVPPGSDPATVSVSINAANPLTDNEDIDGPPEWQRTFTAAGGTFTYLPVVTGLSETSGYVGDQIMVMGTGLGAGGSTPIVFTGAAGTTQTYGNCPTSTWCMVNVPLGKGAVDVEVKVGAATSAATAADRFVYDAPIVTGLSPSQGPTTGDTLVTISGRGLDDSMLVSFGATAAPINGFDGDPRYYVRCNGTTTTCTVMSPPVANAGITVPVTVNVDGVASAPSAASQFTYDYVPPAVNGLVGSTTLLWSGQSETATVSIDEPAPSGGTLVTLTSSDPASLTVPATVTIPAGAKSTTFTVTSLPTTTVGVEEPVSITAKGGGGTAVCPILLAKGDMFLSYPGNWSGSTALYFGEPAKVSLLVFVRAPVTADTVVTVATTSSASGVPASITIPKGSSTGSIPITPGKVSTLVTTTVTATVFGESSSLTVPIEPVPTRIPSPPPPRCDAMCGKLCC